MGAQHPTTSTASPQLPQAPPPSPLPPQGGTHRGRGPRRLVPPGLRRASGPVPALTLDGPAPLLAVVEGEEVVGVAVAAPVGELLAALRVPVVVPARHQGAAGAVVGGQQAGALLLCGRHQRPGLKPPRRRRRPRPRPRVVARGVPTCEGARCQGRAGQRQQQRGQRQTAAGGHVATADGREGRMEGEKTGGWQRGPGSERRCPARR